jgi:hypothetical protein
MQRSFSDPLKGFAPGDKPFEPQKLRSTGPEALRLFRLKAFLPVFQAQTAQAFALEIDNCAARHSLRK